MELIIIFKKQIFAFCRAVISVCCRDNGFFSVCCLLCFLCHPPAVKAGYEDEIILSAKHGDAQAQYALALLYEYGSETISRDKQKSLQLLQLSAQKQIAGACLYMGLKHEHGNGVAQDFEKAICYYLCAVRQDWPMAQFFLADFYARGKGVEKSIPTALALLDLARKHGYPRANTDFLKLQKQSGVSGFHVLNDIQEKLMHESNKPCN